MVFLDELEFDSSAGGIVSIFKDVPPAKDNSYSFGYLHQYTNTSNCDVRVKATTAGNINLHYSGAGQKTGAKYGGAVIYYTR